MMIYTVDNILEKLALVGNNKIWKETPEGVLIKGVVSNVKSYKEKTSYFDLVGSGKRIKACCDYNDTPMEGEAIEFNGLITLKTNDFGTNLQVLIKGSPVGTWERHKSGPVLSSQDLVKYNNQPLSSIMGEFSHGHEFVILGSDTAINDVVSTVNEDAAIQFNKKIITVSNKKEVMKAVGAIGKRMEPIAAFAIVRGGDDDSMSVWDDPEVVKTLLDVKIPFYTALGHAHRLTLADKYAAQCFPTPSNLASSINIALSDYQYAHSQIFQINKLTEELKAKDNTSTESVLHAQETYRRWKKVALFLLLISILLMGYIIIK